MTQDKPELLAGSGNFPRTDADGDNRRPAVVAPDPGSTLNRGDNILTGVATRSVAQLAESSRVVAPLLKGFDTELKAIRTALKPNKGILKSLQNIEKHIAKADKDGTGKKAALSGSDDDRLDKLVESMERSAFIADNIAQNTAYIAQAVDKLVDARKDGDGRRDRDDEGPREAVEEKKNKRLSKTFADSLDNSRMAKEMEKGFKKVSAMQALNSFANLGQGGGAGMLNSLIDGIGKGVLSALCSPLGLAAAAGSIGGILLGLWADRNSAKREQARDDAHAKAQAGFEARLSDAQILGQLAREKGLDTKGLGDSERIVHAFEETRKHVESAKDASRIRLSKKLRKKPEDVVVSPDDIDFDKDLTKEQKIKLIAQLQNVGKIDHTKYNGWDTFINTATGWDRLDKDDQNQAREYFNQVKYQQFTKKADGHVSASHGANRANQEYADAANFIQKMKDDTEFDKHKQTGNTVQYRNVLPSSNDLYHPEYSNDPTLKKMDDMMRSINPNLSGKDLAKLIDLESAGTWDPTKKTEARAPGKENTKKDIFDAETNLWRPSTAIGIGQWTRLAMQDMDVPGVDTKSKDAKNYYQSFRNTYPTVDSQIPLFKKHWESKGVLDKVAKMNREDALDALYLSHFAGNSALNSDGSLNEKTTADELSQNNGMTRRGYIDKVKGRGFEGLDGILGAIKSGANPGVAWSENVGGHDSSGASHASLLSASTGKDYSGEIDTLQKNGYVPKNIGGNDKSPTANAAGGSQQSFAFNNGNRGGDTYIKIEGWGHDHGDLYGNSIG